MSEGAILTISLLAMFIIGGPIAQAMGSSNSLIAVVVGTLVFTALSGAFGRRHLNN